MSLLSTITPENHAEWLAERQKSVGASEVAAALGVCPYTTPIELWQRKLGLAPPVVETEAMRWGLALEPLIQVEYERRTGRIVTASQAFLRHPHVPHMTATLDGITNDLRILEIKTASAWSRDWGDEDSDQIPDAYTIQVHAQMCVSGLSVADVAVLIGGQRLRIFTVECDDTLCGQIEEGVRRFWKCVESRTPPDWGRVTAASLLIRNPGCEGEATIAGHINHIVARYEALGCIIQDAEASRDDCKLEILEALGSHQFARLDDGRIVKRYVQEMPERTQTVMAHTRHYFRLIKGDRS